MTDIFVKILKNGKNLYKIKQATEGSAGFDINAAIEKDIVLESSKSILIPCGFSIELPRNFEAQVRPRSGLALKNMITVLNSPGTIDSDYRGEICVILINHGKDSFIIERGMRIAQIVFAKLPNFKLIEVKELSSTKRGKGGFGSTGLK